MDSVKKLSLVQIFILKFHPSPKSKQEVRFHELRGNDVIM